MLPFILEQKVKEGRGLTISSVSLTKKLGSLGLVGDAHVNKISMELIPHCRYRENSSNFYLPNREK